MFLISEISHAEKPIPSPSYSQNAHSNFRLDISSSKLSRNSLHLFKTSISNIDELIRLGSLTPNMASFLEAAVKSKMNILVCGGTGSGKTTLGSNLNQIREGIVIRPLDERYEDELGRVMLKSVSEAYKLRKGETTEYN